MADTKEVAVTAPVPSSTDLLALAKETLDPEMYQALARDILEREVARSKFGQDAALARIFANAGVFADIRVNDINNPNDVGVALAMTKISLGRSWGMSPADAMESIYFTQGRPGVTTGYIAARLQEAGIHWDIGWDEADGVCTGCHLALKRVNAAGQFEPVMAEINGVPQRAVVSFTKADADKAIINEKGKEIPLSQKWNYKSWAADMYYARAVSRVKKHYAPNLLGNIPMRAEVEDDMPQASPRPAGAATVTQEKQNLLGEKLRHATGIANALIGPANGTATNKT